MTEKAFQCNETMETRYKQEWGQFGLAEVVGDKMPDLERHMGRHQDEQKPSGIADHARELAE